MCGLPDWSKIIEFSSERSHAIKLHHCDQHGYIAGARINVADGKNEEEVDELFRRDRRNEQPG